MTSFVILSSAAFAQAESAETITERGAQFLWKTLDENLRLRAGDRQVLGKQPMHFVFLVDTAQATASPNYQQYYEDVIRRFLKRVAKAEQDLKVPPDGLSHYSIYPYQKELYDSGDDSIVGADKAFKLTENEPVTLDGLAALQLPRAQITHEKGVSTPYTGGHRPSIAREQAISRLGTSDKTRTTVLVMFTPFSDEQDPSDPTLSQRVSAQDARCGGLSGGDWACYDSKDAEGLPLKSIGDHPVDVYVWSYGPKEVPSSSYDTSAGGTGSATGTTTAGSTSSTSSTSSTGGSTPPCPGPDCQPKTPIALFIALAIAAALVAGFFGYKFYMREFNVKIGQVTASVTAKQPLELWGYGSSPAAGRLVLGPAESSSFAKEEQVGSLAVGFGAKISPATGVSMFVGGANDAETSANVLEGTPLSVKFVGDRKSTTLFTVTLTRTT